MDENGEHRSASDTEITEFGVSSGFGAEDHKARVIFDWQGNTAALTPTTARRLSRVLAEAAESAELCEAVVRVCDTEAEAQTILGAVNAVREEHSTP